MTSTYLFLNGQRSRNSFGACKTFTHVFFQRISILTLDFNTSLVVQLTNVPTVENFALILFFLFLVGTSFSRLVQGNTRQGRRQEWQVLKLISPEEEKEKKEEKNKRERERCTHHHDDHHHQPLHPYHGHRRMSASPAPLSSSAASKAATISPPKNQNEKKPRGLGSQRRNLLHNRPHTEKSVPRCCLNTCNKCLRNSGHTARGW